MGSRIGYRVKHDTEHSDILRKQWVGSLKEGVYKMWTTLGGTPGDGGQAIRHDLDIGRGFAAMVVSFYEPPFNSIEKDTRCDIADNGLIEVDISDYQAWKVYHIGIGYLGEDDGKEGKRTQIATMDKLGFTWIIDDKQRKKLGEGLD